MPTADAILDVLVIGGGPAGWAAAITLAGKGLGVGVADRARASHPYGETLAPGGATMLRGLGAWDGFQAGPHIPCYTYRAVWGSAASTQFDLLRSPGGPAWMIDRAALVGAMCARAVSCGVRMLPFAGPVTAGREAGAWKVLLGAQGVPLRARWIVDASGRAGVVARRMGARHVADDRQVAFMAALPLSYEQRGHAPVLVEAAADGWWYSASTPSGHLAVAYFTDRDLVDVSAVRERRGLIALLARTDATAQRVADICDTFEGQVQVIAAHDSAIDRVWGDGWVAAGEAAFAYDPLSGHGITAALASGRDAAGATIAALAGDEGALSRYGGLLAHARGRYRTRRAYQYASERRWAGHPFWARRNAVPPAPPRSPQTRR